MEIANINDFEEIMNLYIAVVDAVNKTDVKLGWNTSVYPDKTFIQDAISKKQLLILRNEGAIIAAAVVNHVVNEEYKLIDWRIKEPEEKIATIHAIATSPTHRGKRYSDIFLSAIEKYCKNNGDAAIHLDVIDTNYPAYKLYLRNDYIEIDNIEMYYEVVGKRKFWMMEKIL